MMMTGPSRWIGRAGGETGGDDGERYGRWRGWGWVAGMVVVQVTVTANGWAKRSREGGAEARERA